MRKIKLYGPAVDRHGQYRDAGDELSVGGEDNADTDISTADAEKLLESGRAVTLTQAAAHEAAARGEAPADPLDHDRDGRKGGAASPKA